MNKTIVNTHDCSDELRELNFRATPARVAIMRFLEQVSEPVDTYTIINYLNKNKIKTDPATVFRIIKIFTEKGITTPIQFQEGKVRYELSSKEDHHHLICESCGRIEDISDCIIPTLENDIKNKKHFSVKSHSLEFYGLCQNCQ